MRSRVLGLGIEEGKHEEGEEGLESEGFVLQNAKLATRSGRYSFVYS